MTGQPASKLAFETYNREGPARFVSQERTSGIIDPDGRVYAIWKNRQAKHEGDISRFIAEHKLVKLPTAICNREGGRIVSGFSADLVVCDGKDIFVDPACEIIAEFHEPVRVGTLPRREEPVVLKREIWHVIIGVEFSPALSGLERMPLESLLTSLQYRGLGEPVKLTPSYDRAAKEFRLAVLGGLPFDVFVDGRFQPNIIPYESLSRGSDNSLVGKIAIQLSPFSIYLRLKGPDARKINAMRLIAQSNRGRPRNDIVLNRQGQFTSQFLGLDWAEGPFDLSADANGVRVLPLVIDLPKYFERLTIDKTSRSLALSLDVQTWSFVSKLGIQVLSEAGTAPPSDLTISLQPARDLPPEFDAKEQERLANSNGEVVFPDVFDWQRAEVTVRDANRFILISALKLSSPQVSVETSGADRIDCKIRLLRKKIIRD